jgi:hypothetical protein
MTREELEAIKRRAEAATPGPWRIDGPERVISHFDENGRSISAKIGYWPAGPKTYGDYESEFFSKQDAEFIVASRTDVPALVAEVEKLRKVVAYMLSFADYPPLIEKKIRGALEE